MKKISILLSAIVALVGFTGCSVDSEPVYKAPTTFVLNNPVLQDQYIELTEGGVIDLVCSQPDYGYSAICEYSAEASLTPDFQNYVSLPSMDGTLAHMKLSETKLTLGILEAEGIDSQEAFDAKIGSNPRPVYFRAVAQLPNLPDTRIVSNVVSYNKVVFFYDVPTAGFIYLIGACGGWTEPSDKNAASLANWRLFESDQAIGSKIYSGVFNIAAGKATFRFYTELTGWDGGASVGSQEEDNAIDFDFVDGRFTNDLVKGKGSFSFPNWEGGEMTIIVDMSGASWTVTMIAGAQEVKPVKFVYVVGSQAGWAEPNEESQSVYDNWRLADKDDSGVYSAVLDIPASDWYFRIYPELTGWGATPYSANAAGDNVDITLGTAYKCETGEGCWVLKGWEGGKVNLTLDTNNGTMTVEAVE